MTTALERLAALGLALPAGVTPAAHYVPAVQHGGVLHLSGQTPRVGVSMAFSGTVGTDVSLEEAQHAARVCALRLLSVARDAAGSLEAISQVLHLTVFVQSGPSFHGQSQVADAASELLTTVLGERGRHARTAVGVARLPANAVVEIAAVMALAAQPAH